MSSRGSVVHSSRNSNNGAEGDPTDDKRDTIIQTELKYLKIGQK
jgi:hypothetical protein